MSRGPSARVRRILTAGAIVAVAAALAVLAPAFLPGSADRDAPQSGLESAGITDSLARPLPADHPRTRFVDVTADAGAAWRHGPARRRSLLPEDMGSGCALEDLDGDGDLDLFLVAFSANVERGTAADVPEVTAGPTHRLLRNDGGRFTDVTAGSGLDVRGLGMGVAAGDADGDGRLDLYVTAYGRNRLFRNLGELRFEDVTDAAGVGDPGFGAGAAFGDVDRDGDMDLYVCNYVEFQWDGRPPPPGRWRGYALPATLNPSSYPPVPNRFYRNRGDGTFEEVAAELGMQDVEGRSLTCTFADFNDDGWPDLYVLNDVSKNAYFENRGDGTFEDRSLASLSADYRGAMGNAVCDLDGDGDLDLFITHWIAQENGLYQNLLAELADKGERQPLMFMDSAEHWGLGHTGLNFVGWGTAFIDYDLDGAADLVIVNGSTMPAESGADVLSRQRPQLFWHKPGERFFDAGAAANEPFSDLLSARGLAEGDLDGDGDPDLVVTENCGPLHVLRNEGPTGGWLSVRLRRASGNRFGVGARVRVTAGGRSQTREVGAGTSYLCHRPLEVLFGLGPAEAADVEVRWPDGRVTRRAGVRPGTRLALDEE